MIWHRKTVFYVATLAQSILFGTSIDQLTFRVPSHCTSLSSWFQIFGIQYQIIQGFTVLLLFLLFYLTKCFFCSGHIFFTVKLVSNMFATLYFFCSMYLFRCVIDEFERKNGFQQTVKRKAFLQTFFSMKNPISRYSSVKK